MGAVVPADRQSLVRRRSFNSADLQSVKSDQFCSRADKKERKKVRKKILKKEKKKDRKKI